MSRQGFAEARKWCGRNGLIHWEHAGAHPSAAAYGAFIMGQIANPDASGNLKGWDFSSDLVDSFVKDVTSCKTMDDIEKALERSYRRIALTDPLDAERTFGSKNFRVFYLQDEEAFKDAKDVRSWAAAEIFNIQQKGILDSVSADNHADYATAGMRSNEICMKYGLSSLMIPLHVENPMDILDRIDGTLSNVVKRMRLEEPASLGAFGRLSISFSIKNGQTAMGVCSTVDEFKDGFISLPVDFEEKTVHHELMHWYDVCARWGLGVGKSPYIESDCLSAAPMDEYYRNETAIRAIDALIEFKDKNERYVHECASIGRKIFGISHEDRDYFKAPQEILARAFEFGVDDTFDRQFEWDVSLIDQSLGEDMNVLSRKFIDAVKQPVLEWSLSNKQPWAEGISWHSSRLHRENNLTLDDTSEMLLSRFSKIPTLARTGVARLGALCGMRP